MGKSERIEPATESEEERDCERTGIDPLKEAATMGHGFICASAYNLNEIKKKAQLSSTGTNPFNVPTQRISHALSM